MSRRRAGWVSLMGAGALLFAAMLAAPGCASSRKKVEEVPQTVEAVVEAEPAEPETIGYVEARPWSATQGETVEFVVGATAGRKARVHVSPVGGGPEHVVELTDDGNGRYTGRWTIPDDLAPGAYRVEAELTETTTGEPVKLTSSRTLSVAAAVRGPTLADCQRVRDELAKTFVHFAFDKSDLDETAQAILAGIAEKIAGVKERVTGLTVVGHCDSRGTIEYNLALGARRAAAVRDALAARPDLRWLSIETLSMGEEKPLIPNARTEAEHAQNRRAEFRLSCGG